MNLGEMRRELNRMANFAKAFAKLEEVLAQAQEAENLLKTAQKQSQEAVDAQKSAQNAIPELQKQIDGLEAVYAEKMTAMDGKLLEHIEELNTTLANKRIEVANEIDTLSNNLKKAKAKYDAKMAELQADQDAAEKEVANWQQKLAGAQEAYNAFKAAVGG